MKATVKEDAGRWLCWLCVGGLLLAAILILIVWLTVPATGAGGLTAEAIHEAFIAEQDEAERQWHERRAIAAPLLTEIRAAVDDGEWEVAADIYRRNRKTIVAADYNAIQTWFACGYYPPGLWDREGAR